ncbi:WD40 repeat domain-containing serine/threonine protein kinase [Paludisphaera mucosa]|uniref:Protein kinase n=1 Tax=Paludisphaera mucosa TaxID=3030827 RepID=A0ABT6FA31_9BACT|nr:protein kinase [Paludisphaera mucosa]MDG3004240.1 protein kinase [Paludisphaera mucosa]
MDTSSDSRDYARFDELAEGDARGDEPSPPPTLPRLRQVGDYRILREVGRGGMGIVYEAEQVSLGRRVALKVLPARVAGDRLALLRFRREAKAAARLHHTNIVPVYEVGRDGEVAFYAMQFIHGQGLDQVVDELRRLRDHDRKSGPDHQGRPSCRAGIVAGRYSPATSTIESNRLQLDRVAGSLLTGLLSTDALASPEGRAAPASDPAPTERFDPDPDAGSQPRDPPPDLDETEPSLPGSSSAVLPGGTLVSAVESSGRRQPYFRSVAQIGRQAAQGLAYAHARGIVHRDVKPSNLLLDTAGIVWITDFGLAKTDDDGLTATGDVLGTIRYMAPERFRGEGDARADVYALGLTLYELLTLRPAYDSPDRLKQIERIKAEEPPRPRLVDRRIPRDLETIVLRAIAKDPERRYPTARAMAEDLRRFLADEPILARQASAAERYWRWAHRNPVVAVMGGVLTGVLVLATIGSLLAARRFHAQAETEHKLADDRETRRREADQANVSLRATQEELRRTVYATRSNLALSAWDAADVGRLRNLLDLLRPAPGEADLRGWEWRYLWRLAHEDRLTLRAKDDFFADVAFSPDGRALASLQSKGLIQLWDRWTGSLIRSMGVASGGRRADLGGGVGALAFSPDGRTLAGPGPGPDDGLALYTVDTGQVALRFEGPSGPVQGLAWSPDGGTLVAALSVHHMRMWDARDGRRIHRVFGGHKAPVAAVAYSPDGRTIASASYDRTVKLWDPRDPVHPRAVLEGHADEVRAVAFSPDGRRVASGGLDRTLRIWDAASGTPIAVYWGHPSAVVSLAYGPDGARIVTGSADETVRVWDAATGEELHVFKGHADEVVAVALSPDGRDLASAGADATVRLWDSASPPQPRALQSPSVLTYGGDVECLAYSPDGSRLVSGHDDHALRLWELPSGRLLRVIKGHARDVMCVAFSPDGRTLASGSLDNTVRLWDAATGEPRITFTGHTADLRAVVFAPDGRTVFSGGADHAIQAWDPATGAVRYVLRGHDDMVHDLAFSPDGRTLASAGYDRTCILWDLAAGRPRATLRGHADRVNAVAFSPDGRSLATASSDHTVRLWDASDGAPRGRLEGHVAAVDGVAFGLDGRLASSAEDKTIRLWEPAGGQTLLVLKGHAGRIRCIKFSPDGRTLASASYDRTVKLWEAAPADVLQPAGGAGVGRE